jgi:hypothetical protein
VTSAVTETAPSGSTLTVTIDTAPLGPAFPCLGRQQCREIAHVRHAGLDHDGKADAVTVAGGAPRRVFA